LLIKNIKSVLWRAAKRLSYIEDARCLKVNNPSDIILLFCIFSSCRVPKIIGLSVLQLP